jgi:hypothetical protein
MPLPLNNLLQCLIPSLNPRSESSQETHSPTISAPFNTRIIRNSSTRSLSDNPNVNTALLRHEIGPGIQFMSDLHYERFFHKTTNQYNIPTELEIPQRAPYIILAGDIGRL